jgi:hypothetical protein
MKLCLYGSHGTTATRAEGIKKCNFTSRGGRGGDGVYFWRENDYSSVLAKGWYEYLLNDQQYVNDLNKSFEEIKVMITVEEDNYIDLETDEMKDELAKMAKNKNLVKKLNEDEICAFFNYIIERLEKKCSTKFLVWKLRLNPPRNCVEYPFYVLGNPLCYVVNDNCLITIL